jgi:hypothetical protein
MGLRHGSREPPRCEQIAGMGRSCSYGTSTLHGQIAWFRINRSCAIFLRAPYPLFWSFESCTVYLSNISHSAA